MMNAVFGGGSDVSAEELPVMCLRKIAIVNKMRYVLVYKIKPHCQDANLKGLRYLSGCAAFGIEAEGKEQ
jgi:hypothetical protein